MGTAIVGEDAEFIEFLQVPVYITFTGTVPGEKLHGNPLHHVPAAAAIVSVSLTWPNEEGLLDRSIEKKILTAGPFEKGTYTGASSLLQRSLETMV